MFRDLFKSIYRGFGFNLGKMLFFALLGLIVFILTSKAYALETNTIVGIMQDNITFPNTLGYDYSNYNPTTTYHYIKETINDNSIDFNYLVTLDNECWSSIYIQEKNYFSTYYNADTTKIALFNYYGGYNFDRYNMFNYGLEYNMKINYNFCQNLGEVIQPLRIGDMEPYYYGKNNSVYGSILDYLEYKDLNILDISTEDYYFIPVFSNYEAIRWSQGSLIWLYGPNSMLLPTLGTIPYTNSYNNATGGGGGEDNPPSGETGKDYTNILEEISSKVGTGFQNIREELRDIKDKLDNIIDFITSSYNPNTWLQNFDNIKSLVSGFFNTIINNIINPIKNFFNDIIYSLNNNVCTPLSFTIFETDFQIPCVGSILKNKFSNIYNIASIVLGFYLLLAMISTFIKSIIDLISLFNIDKSSFNLGGV